MYIAFLRRRAVEELETRKSALTTGLWANEGLNDDKGTRAQALEELDEQFEEAKKVIYADADEVERVANKHKFTKEDEENPFLAPAIRATRGIEKPRDDEGLKETQPKKLEIDQI